MKGITLKLTVVTAMVFAGMMALAQIAEAAGKAEAPPPPAPLAQAVSSVPKGVGLGIRSGFLGNTMAAKDTQLSLRVNMDGMAISPYLGFGTEKSGDFATEIAMGIRILPTIAKSKQATFSALIGLGAMIGEDADWYLGMDLVGGFGAEYFFPGLPNVGFSLEAGLDFNLCVPFADGANTSFGISTVGSTFSGGIHYYFN